MSVDEDAGEHTGGETVAVAATYNSAALRKCQSRRKVSQVHQGRRANHGEPPGQWPLLLSGQIF